MSQALDALLSLLDLEELEVNIFRGRSPQEGSQRVFGGQVLGQAMVAAGRTADERAAHSLHAYFLRPGDPSAPILYEVDRTRDGRSFTTRRVTAIQRGRAIFHLESSFHIPEAGFEHQMGIPDVPDPETLPTWREHMECRGGRRAKQLADWFAVRPFEVRLVTQFDPLAAVEAPAQMMLWIRTDGKLPDAPLLHQCAVAYASDLSLIDTAALPHRIQWDDEHYLLASLDHGMWFHRDLRADDWLLYVQESPAAASGRAFSTGRIYRRDGVLAVSVVQEGLFRRLSPRGPA